MTDHSSTAPKPKKILYFDMDGVLVNFMSGFEKLDAGTRERYKDMKDLDEIEGIFALMDPMPGALEAVKKLHPYYDIFILSTSPWNNTSGPSDKLAWVKKNFQFGSKKEENYFYKRVIFSHNKQLNKGDLLIDDREKNGAKDFDGEHILFNSHDPEQEWQRILNKLLP